MTDRPAIITSRIREIQNQIFENGKDQPEFAKLIAVSKYSPVEEIIMAYNSGHFDFGENRLSELKEKSHNFENLGLFKVNWHFIGHLQTNKVKDLLRIPNLYAIHSIDSIKLIEELLKRENEVFGKKIHIFLQYNTSREEEKSGFESKEELIAAIELLSTNKGSFHLMGLMTMGQIRTDDVNAAAKDCFQELIAIRNCVHEKCNLADLKLSMGMSGDYKIALSLGSNFIRVGTSIFK